MTNRLNITPDRKPKKNHLDWPSSQIDAEVDGDHESSDSSTINDMCGSCESATSAEYDGESLDFGDSGAELI
jgi:hypothetical protein